MTGTYKIIMQQTSVKYQYLAALTVNLLFMVWGFCCGWPSPNLSILMSDKTPLESGKIGMEECSYIAAFLCIGAFFGNLFFGFITSRFGRKQPMLFIAIPAIGSWLLIMYAQSVYHLYAARILNGFVGGGIFVTAPQFLSEIASDRVRGVLGSTTILCCNFGILMAFTLGDYCDYYTTPKVVIVLTCLFAALFTFFPESPTILMKQNRIPETENSVRFYHNLRGAEKDHELLQSKMKKLEGSFGSSTNEKSSNSVSLSDFKATETRKAFVIGIVLAALNQFCDCFAMLNYTASIFEEAGSTMLPNTSAIVVGAIQLFGSYAATNLVERGGRKFLYALSTIGTALGLATLGVYMMLKTWKYEVEAFSWIPITSFGFVIFLANFAILTLPFLVISEIMPEKLKDFGSSFCMSILWTSGFIVIKYMPLLTDILGMHGSMFFFAGVCLSSAVFIIVKMPETKGKSYDEIMQSLR